MEYGHHFAKNVCDDISNNMKLMIINAETNATLKLQDENVLTTRVSPWLQCICSKMTSMKYLGALATRVSNIYCIASHDNIINLIDN